DARLARALESLTMRSLEYGPPPDEMWVDIGFRDGAKAPRREIRILWRIVQPGAATRGVRIGTRAAARLAINPAAEQVRRAKKLMFSGKEWMAEKKGAAAARSKGWLKTQMPDAISAKVVPTKALGDIGYIRIWTFDVDDDDTFVNEVARLVEQLPDTGLIIDVRGNPGGYIIATE